MAGMLYLKRPFLAAALWSGLAGVAAPALGAEDAPPLDWREANDTVGQFQRGHIDVLRWEQANLKETPEPPAPAASLSLQTAADAVRRAWTAHLSLAGVQAQLGPALTEAVAQGRWMMVDPSMHRRVQGLGELLAVAREARQAWIQAVAARQGVGFHRESLIAAETAHELGRRMVQVGNWSRLQGAPASLALSEARMALQRAEYAQALAERELIRVLGLTGRHDHVALPDSLPALPDALIGPDAVDAHLQRLRAQLQRAEAMRAAPRTRMAYEAYRASHVLAAGYRDEILKTRELMAEEAVLRYNGMLKSVWDVLSETRQRFAAAAETVNAQRDFWLAEADLQWVLQGGEPASFVSLGGGGAAASAAPAH
ncbi:TolC family protein [Caldimonas caldifontis]|uniref:TolC family protein n=1 Tax=Caldimonas caldifontis TaxID=1452508 RepID=UPI0011B0E8B4|nr:TolC family protein [Caldimonas caldifontis]